jgi:protein SCO1/2
MTGRPMAPPASWLGTAIASCTMIGIAAAALWSVTFGLRGWTAEEIRRLRVPADPPQLHALRLDTSTGISLVPWGNREAQPRIWLVTFMYTRCPTVCSVLGIEFERLQRQLNADPRNAGIGLLSISFDPVHDDVQALQRYAAEHHAEPDRWTVAVPDSRADLARVEHQTGVVVIDDGFGGFAHNAAIHVVRADGRLVRIFDFNQPEAALAWARTQRESR